MAAGELEDRSEQGEQPVTGEAFYLP